MVWCLVPKRFEHLRHRMHGTWVKDKDEVTKCSYCGGLHVQEAIKFLQQPGTQFSGSDWKYGWPHKFYIEPQGKYYKFYNEHLQDCTDAELEVFSKLSEQRFGIKFFRGEKGILYSSPQSNSPYGFQRAGVIKENGEIEHTF